MALTEEEQRLEEEHLRKVLRVIRHDYQTVCTQKLGKYYHDAPPDCAVVCPEYLQRLARVGEAVQVNQRALRELTATHEEEDCLEETVEEVGLFVENCKSLLRQLVREWSEEGERERLVYSWIIEKVKLYSDGATDKQILVPGAGLGRLPWELAKCGFAVQGNEFSNFMLLPSEHILNHLTTPITIHPFLFPFSNTTSVTEQLRSVTIPDVMPARDSEGIHDFSFVAGDFLQVYNAGEYDNHFDLVTACFFLDTAKNIIEYLKTIRRVLKPGGLMVNIGPLLYHFEGSSEEPSVELTLEELKLVLGRMGFVVMEETWMETTYVQNSASLLSSVYKCYGSVWRRI